MMDRTLKAAVADVAADTDATRKAAKLASLCSALFRARGTELVVVGGSAIELLTDGAYASGDLDLCSLTSPTIPLRVRQEIMGQLGAQGGPRSWDDWLKGRRWRRELGERVAPKVIRRPRGPADRRLRKLFNGSRGLPFPPTEEL